MENSNQYKSKKRVTISIACYNKLEFTKQCLEYLYKNTDNKLFNLVIVDNGSSDGTSEWLIEMNRGKTDLPINNSIFLINKINNNFSGAHNQAFRHCKTEYFLPLNNDIIPRKNWLEPLIEAMDNDKNIGVAGSKLISPLVQGIQHAGVIFRKDSTPIHKSFAYDPNDEEVNKPGYCPAVTGACMITRSSLYKKVGGFDQIYKNGWEDIDYDLKIRSLGYQIYYEPKSSLYHYEGQTEGRMDNDDTNRFIFLKRWYEWIQLYGNNDYKKILEKSKKQKEEK